MAMLECMGHAFGIKRKENEDTNEGASVQLDAKNCTMDPSSGIYTPASSPAKRVKKEKRALPFFAFDPRRSHQVKCEMVSCFSH